MKAETVGHDWKSNIIQGLKFYAWIPLIGGKSWQQNVIHFEEDRKRVVLPNSRSQLRLRMNQSWLDLDDSIRFQDLPLRLHLWWHRKLNSWCMWDRSYRKIDKGDTPSMDFGGRTQLYSRYCPSKPISISAIHGRLHSKRWASAAFDLWDGVPPPWFSYRDSI
jgi:hypothetical protein